MTIYYYPDDYGLELIGTAEEENLEYEFSMFAVWRDKTTGLLFYADSSGCSCPSPFEEYGSVNDLHSGDIHHILDALDVWVQDYYGYGEENNNRAGPAMNLREKLVNFV